MSVGERLKILFDKDYEFFNRAEDAVDVEPLENYSQKLRAELDRLKSQDDRNIDQLELLTYLTTLQRLELANQQMEQTILNLDNEIKLLSDRETQEAERERSVHEVKHHLDKRLEKLESLDTDNELNPENIINKIRSRTKEEKESSQALLRSLKYVLNGCVFSSIENMSVDSEIEPKEIASKLRKTVQILINARLEAESGLSDGYIEFDGDADDPILQFLIRGELVTTKPGNLRLIKLRSYGS
ncbi:hypothetical protein TRVA0_034S00694 [Trichomonascus vanleenenianus]|uniref:uncharacterized protein n=1 Tax=Trichomonascus vanleenenianus TaxID=2268995 RepID=UPI003ECA480A